MRPSAKLDRPPECRPQARVAIFQPQQAATQGAQRPKKSEPRGTRLEVEQGGVNEGWKRTGEVLHPNQRPYPIGNV